MNLFLLLGSFQLISFIEVRCTNGRLFITGWPNWYNNQFNWFEQQKKQVRT